MKKAICLVVIILMFMSIFINSVYAESTPPGSNIIGGNLGGGNGNVSTNNSYTWSTEQQGYRFTIVDSQGKPISKSIDIVYSQKGILNATSYTYIGSKSNQGVKWVKNGSNNWTSGTIDYAIEKKWLPSTSEILILEDGTNTGKKVGSMPPALAYNGAGFLVTLMGDIIGLF